MLVRASTMCPFCGCQCGMYLVGENLLGAATIPAQTPPRGASRLCLRGWQAGSLLRSPRLLDTPLRATEPGFAPADWDTSLAEIASALSGFRGSDSIGLLLSGGLTNEEAFALAQLARVGLGGSHLDGLFALHEGAALTGLRYSLGEAGQGAQLSQIPECDLLVSFSGDLSSLYPQAAAYVLSSIRQGVPLIVVDSLPGALGPWAQEVILVEPGGLATVAQALAGVPWTTEVEAAGLAAEQWEAVREMLLASERPGLLVPLTQISSPQAACAIGEIILGLRATAPVQVFILHGEPNVAGVSEVALGQQGAEAGLCVDEMLQPGKLKALIVVEADLAEVLPGPALEQLAESLDLLVVIASYRTPTTQVADFVLPMAGFGERAGSLTGPDGLLRWTEQAFEPGGQRQALINIVSGLSQQLGTPVEWSTLEELQGALSRQVPGYGQIDWAGLRREGTWPRGTYPVNNLPSALGAETSISSVPAEEEQFLLLVRPDGQHWALDARTQGGGILEREYQQSREPYLWVSPEDLEEKGWREGAVLQVTTEHSCRSLPVRSREGLRPGWAILPRQFVELAIALAGPPYVHRPVGAWEWRPISANLSTHDRESGSK